MSEQADKFLEIFREACRVIPDKQILINWMVFTLGVLSVHSTDDELKIIEKEVFNQKQNVRH